MTTHPRHSASCSTTNMAITKLKLMKSSLYKLYSLESELQYGIKQIQSEIFQRHANKIKDLEEQVKQLKEKK